MNQSVRNMLENVFHLFAVRYKKKFEAWDKFIEFIAVDNDGSIINQLFAKLDWIKDDREFGQAVMKVYNPRILVDDYHDHLGDMYFEKFLKDKIFQADEPYYMTMQDAYEMYDAKCGKTDLPIRILDPHAGTGRYLMAASKLAPNAMLFGVERDIRAMRVALVNFAIHRMRGFLLNADCKVHTVNLDNEDGLYNWSFANNWYSQLHELRKIK